VDISGGFTPNRCFTGSLVYLPTTGSLDLPEITRRKVKADFIYYLGNLTPRGALEGKDNG